MSEKSVDLLTVILAAGEGTRMRSNRAKVLHEVAGLSLLGHVIKTTIEAEATVRLVVIGPERQDVHDAAMNADPDAKIFVQTERLGTAHALNAAREAWEGFAGNVLILFGDTPLMTAQTLQNVHAGLSDADIVVVGFDAENPHGYGRLLMEGDQLIAIREEKEATDAERKTTYCNSGVMGIKGPVLAKLVDGIKADNASNEFYLTDAIEVANTLDLKVTSVETSETETQGINTRVQLAQVEADFQKRARIAHMLAGVTLIAPETVFFSHDTQIGQDVTIEPHVIFGPKVTIAAGAEIKGFSHFDAATIGENAAIGPYARLRPGAEIGNRAKVGNFCEIKKAQILDGAKVNHLSYIGDATVGAGANIGAGTITCNYDGFNKSRTIIGEGAFIGSNSSLVAPVEIGVGAYVGSGSVITKNVAPDSLAIGRTRQADFPGHAAKIRARNKKSGKK